MTDAPVTDVKPGWTTTEFWSTIVVQALAALSVLLDSLHINWSHLSDAQAAVPVVALVAATVAQVLYAHKRTSLKIVQLQSDASVAVAKVKAGMTTVTDVVNDVKPFVPVAEKVPAIAADIAKIEKVVKPLVADVEKVVEAVEKKPAAPEVAAPVVEAPAVEVAAPVNDIALGTGVHTA